MHTNYVYLYGAIDTDALLLRWESITWGDFCGLVLDLSLPSYSVRDTLISPDGQTVHLCVLNKESLGISLFGRVSISYIKTYVYDIKDVILLEVQEECKYFTWKKASLEDATQLTSVDIAACSDQGMSENIVVTPQSPEEWIKQLQKNGITDNKELAAKVDEFFFGISDAGLGKLLPASPGATVSWDANNSRGRRLRGKKK